MNIRLIKWFDSIACNYLYCSSTLLICLSSGTTSLNWKQYLPEFSKMCDKHFSTVKSIIYYKICNATFWKTLMFCFAIYQWSSVLVYLSTHHCKARPWKRLLLWFMEMHITTVVGGHDDMCHNDDLNHLMTSRSTQSSSNE